MSGEAELEPLLRHLSTGRSVLAVGADEPLEGTATVRRLTAPSAVADLDEALREVALGAYDVAVVGSWGHELSPRELVDRVSRRVRPGGLVVLRSPTSRSGWRAMLGGLIRRHKPYALEELCEAMLLSHLVEVSAREPQRAGTFSVVWARVPDPP